MKKDSIRSRNGKGDWEGKKLTIGMDLGDRTSRYCVLGEEGEVLLEESVATTQKGLSEAFSAVLPCRMAIETADSGSPGPHRSTASESGASSGRGSAGGPSRDPCAASTGQSTDDADQCRAWVDEVVRRAVAQVRRLLKQVKGVGTLIALTFVPQWTPQLARSAAKVLWWGRNLSPHLFAGQLK
jgi:hypothetical protein